jgi:U3 small nucleolar RNA-associated protein 14
MPRQAHGRSNPAPNTLRPPKQKSARSRNLNAFAIAQQEDPTKNRVRPSRLGEIEEDRHERDSHTIRDQDDTDHPAKRRRIHGRGHSTDEEDARGDSEGHEWHLGVDDDDEDSDIDSDEAMGESDAERFQGFTFRGSSAPSSKAQPGKKVLVRMNNLSDVSLQGSSEEYASTDDENESKDEDGLGQGAVDLATALDMSEQYDGAKKELQKKASKAASKELSISQQTPDDGNDSSEDDSSIAGDMSSALSISDDDESGVNHARLKNFVQGLEGHDSSQLSSKPSRPPIAMGEPSDYGLAPSQKLTIADLLGAVTDPRLRKSLKMLHNSEQKGTQVTTKGIPGKLEPPLPKRQQDRLDREAAYEKSKETLGRWIDTVKQNRRAEHISFPLSSPDALAALGTNQLMPISHSEALTPLEAAIQSIMHESGLASVNDKSIEEKIQAFEELQEKKMPIEEVQMRRAELRRARDLLFREELRARRVKKIKSKAYRRVHRKERDKHAQEERAALAAAGALDSEEEHERQDRRRAEERMGARHKESRWAKGLKATGRAGWDEDARLGASEMARKDDELRKRIDGRAPNRSDESQADSTDQESSDDVSIDEYDEVQGLKLKRQLADLDTADQIEPDSRLSSMPFMRKAEIARRAANKAEIEQVQRILAGADDAVEDEDENVAKNGGRRKFGLEQQGQKSGAPQANGKSDFEEPLSEDEAVLRSPTLERASKHRPKLQAGNEANVKIVTLKQHNREAPNGVGTNLSNPWLSGPRNRKPALVSGEPIISSNATLQDPEGKLKKSGIQQSSLKIKTIAPSTLDDLTSASDSENDEPADSAMPGRLPQRNKELVRMAFAGDDVFEAFAEEKKATMDEEGDQIVDTSLPGWGSWTGAGINKKEQRYSRSRQTASTIKGVDPHKRKDAKLDRVIINEKRSKKVREQPGCQPDRPC